ncbi:MobH family relaxase [Shewanella sp. 10B]|uniref:MobH family relaxase n=1 Tax=Shewanella sp. 10B TaxID=2943322 RepID=UPI00201A9457|nr:MobH family relaxase [Shewanella sp. 10B]
MSLGIKVKYLLARTKDNIQERFGKHFSIRKADRLNQQIESEAQVLDNLLHYPLKNSLIPISSAEMLIRRHDAKIKIIERDIGLAIDGAQFAQRDLVLHTIREFIGYCHLIPASEMDHHQYIGGLLEHSLDVSIRALQNAMSYMLDEMGLIDEDQARRPRYEYAAWVCGLLHDAGKVISNVQVIGENGEVWHPLNENIFEWAQRNNIHRYSVIHNKNRLQNDHETNSVHFLPLVLNRMAKDYLLGSHDDLYSMITQTLVHYHSYRGYLFNAVRKADSDSTYADYARVWLHDSSRKKSLTMGVVNALRMLYSDWKVNRPGSDVFIFNGEVYLAAERPIRQVIEKCLEYDIKIPTSSRALISILIDKRILSAMSSKSTFANLYLGKYSENDIHQFIEHRTGELAKTSPITVIKCEWPNFVIGDNPLPNNVMGSLRYNTQKTLNVHQLYNDDGFSVVTPKVEIPPEEPAAPKEPLGLVQPAEKSPQSAPSQPGTKKDSPKRGSAKKPSSKRSPAKTPQPTSSSTEKKAANRTTEVDQVDASTQTNGQSATDAPLHYPWMTKKRRAKPLDEALLKLLNNSAPDSIWTNDNQEVCINLDFLTTESGQNRPQILNALTFLQMLKLFDNKRNTSVMNLKGTKVTYIVLADDVAAHFKLDKISKGQPCQDQTEAQHSLPLEDSTAAETTSDTPDAPVASSDVPDTPETTSNTPDAPVASSDVPDVPETASNTPDAPVASSDVPDVPETTTNTPDAPVASSDVPDVPETTSNTPDAPEQVPKKSTRQRKVPTQPVIDHNGEEPLSVHEPETMPYQMLLKILKDIDSSLTRSQLRAMLKAEKISPMTDSEGNITVCIPSVQLEELKWKLRNNNEK